RLLLAVALLALIAPPFVPRAAAQAPGLKAAYGFDEASGAAVIDGSGSGNAGTINGATRTNQGRFGGALVFNGSSSIVTVPDAPSLRLTSALTLEAWVYPTAVPVRWADVIMKGVDNYYLMGNTPQSAVPALGSSFTTALYGPSALAANTWSHL